MENSRYLIFTSAGRSFSLPFEDIKIIIAAQTVPDFPDYVPGTVVNEGEVVPVIDLRRRFHYEPKEISDRDCIIITMGEEVSVGLLCDNVAGFTDIPEDKLCKAPNVNEEACADFLKGEFLLEGKPCYVLDSEKVIKLSDREKVANTERKDK
mgnify:FL=1